MGAGTLFTYSESSVGVLVQLARMLTKAPAGCTVPQSILGFWVFFFFFALTAKMPFL